MPLGGLHALPLLDEEALRGPGLCRALAGCISLRVVVLMPLSFSRHCSAVVAAS